MPKYYSLLYINCDNPNECYVIDVIKINNYINIYDYLTNVYLEYRKTKNAGKFKTLCDRLDSMIDDMEHDDIDYDNVCEWIKNDCGEDNFDKIIISEVKPIIVK